MSVNGSVRSKTPTGRSRKEIDEYISFVKQSEGSRSLEKTNAKIEEKKKDIEENEADGTTNPDLGEVLEKPKKKEPVLKPAKKTRPNKNNWFKNLASWKSLRTTVIGAVILGFLGVIYFLVKYFILNEIDKRAISGAKINSKNIEILTSNSASTSAKVVEIKNGIDDIKSLLLKKIETPTKEKAPQAKP